MTSLEAGSLARARARDVVAYASLIEEASKRTGLPRVLVRRMLAEFFGLLGDAVWESGRVEVPGLGVFRLRRREAKRIRTPDGAWHRKPAHDVVSCRVAGGWRTKR